MKQIISTFRSQNKKNITLWTQDHIVGLFIFNVLVVLLLLLKSGGYFSPYYSITINVVVFVSLVAAAFLIGAKSRTFFIVGLFFWIFAGFLRVLGIEVWAERTTVYVFQSLILGMILFILSKKV